MGKVKSSGQSIHLAEGHFSLRGISRSRAGDVRFRASNKTVVSPIENLQIERELGNHIEIPVNVVQKLAILQHFQFSGFHFRKLVFVQ